MNIKPGSKFNLEAMKNPPNECNVAYSWLWNAPITKEGIDERLDGFVKAGIKSLYILPMPKDFGPDSLRTFMDPEYLTEEFWELISYALRKCVSLGIKPWVYDEGGWPSGGACANTLRQNPNAFLKFLRKEEVKLMADKRFYPSGEGFVALLNGKKRLPDDYIASRDCTLTAYYVEKRTIRNCRVDYTNKSVTETFLNNTYEAYKEHVGDLFGTHLPLFFTDEPGLMRDSIADNEFEIFQREFGYDLRDYIYVIEDSGELAVTEEDKKARRDHCKLLGKLFKECTFRPIFDWCEKNGVYYSGHLDIDNRPYGGSTKGYWSLVDGLRNFHVPGIDVIWEQIRYPYGGRAPVDDETLGMGFFPRIAPSAARQEGRNLSLTETFSIYGDGVTPDEMRFVTNYQAIRGINVFNFLTLPYGKSRCAALMMRPAFCPEKPGFYNLKHINEYFARLSYLLRLGYAEGETALYLPCEDFGSSPDDLDDASLATKKLGTSLEEANIAFDIIDDEGIRDALDTGNGLKLGDATYRYISVPDCKYMPDDVRAKTEKYLGAGAPTYEFKNKNLRVLTRKLDTGRLWFIFNEGIEPASEALSLSGGSNTYRIDVQTGSITKTDCTISALPCGEIAVFLITDDEYKTDKCEVASSYEVAGFKERGYDRYILDYTGVRSTSSKEKAPVDDSFSGTVYYEANYKLDSAPKADDVFRICFEDTATSATVYLDGEYACCVGMKPMYANIPASLLKEEGKITVALSNTAANEDVAKREINEWFPKAEVGVYIPKMTVFESRLPALKLGKVTIEKLK